MTPRTLAELRKLHTRAVDARNSYQEALERDDSKILTTLFQELLALHTTHVAGLCDEIEKNAAPAADEGSIIGAVNKTIMGVRSYFGGLGPAVLPSLIDSEEQNIAFYRDALKGVDSERVAGLLASQKLAIENQVARMRKDQMKLQDAG
jgi:hypothetical protein